MKIVTMFILCIIWGIVSVAIVDPPIGYILAFIGGLFIGIVYPKLYDKLF